MKAVLNWIRNVLPNAPESRIKPKPRIEVPRKVRPVIDFSPTVPDLQILQESPSEIDVSFGFDPYDTAEISKK